MTILSMVFIVVPSIIVSGLLAAILVPRYPVRPLHWNEPEEKGEFAMRD